MDDLGQELMNGTRRQGKRVSARVVNEGAVHGVVGGGEGRGGETRSGRVAAVARGPRRKEGEDEVT